MSVINRIMYGKTGLRWHYEFPLENDVLILPYTLDMKYGLDDWYNHVDEAAGRAILITECDWNQQSMTPITLSGTSATINYSPDRIRVGSYSEAMICYNMLYVPLKNEDRILYLSKTAEFLQYGRKFVYGRTQSYNIDVSVERNSEYPVDYDSSGWATRNPFTCDVIRHNVQSGYTDASYTTLSSTRKQIVFDESGETSINHMSSDITWISGASNPLRRDNDLRDYWNIEEIDQIWIRINLGEVNKYSRYYINPGGTTHIYVPYFNYATMNKFSVDYKIDD